MGVFGKFGYTAILLLATIVYTCYSAEEKSKCPENEESGKGRCESKSCNVENGSPIPLDKCDDKGTEKCRCKNGFIRNETADNACTKCVKEPELKCKKNEEKGLPQCERPCDLKADSEDCKNAKLNKTIYHACICKANFVKADNGTCTECPKPKPCSSDKEENGFGKCESKTCNVENGSPIPETKCDDKDIEKCRCKNGFIRNETADNACTKCVKEPELKCKKNEEKGLSQCERACDQKQDSDECKKAKNDKTIYHVCICKNNFIRESGQNCTECPKPTTTPKTTTEKTTKAP